MPKEKGILQKLRDFANRDVKENFKPKPTWDNNKHEMLDVSAMPLIVIKARALYTRDPRKLTKGGNKGQPSFQTVLDKDFVLTHFDKTDLSHEYCFLEEMQVFKPDGVTLEETVSIQDFAVLLTQSIKLANP